MNQFTKMRRSKMVAGAAGIMALTASSWGQTADALIDKLVEKGILSVKEANNLREETDKGFNQAYSVKSGMPDWVNSVKLNGDFRLRYDGAYQDDDNAMIGIQPPFTSPATAQTEDRNRFRYRLRFGVTVAMADQFEVGFRLASGDGINAVGADPISTNTTLDNNGTKKAVNIDLAYARWTPKDWLMVEGGKMNNEFWMSEVIFDGDYTPEGAQEKLNYVINDRHSVSWTSGQFVIDENFAPNGVGNNNDTYLFVNQVDWTAKWNPKMTSRVAAGVMNFYNYKDNSVTTPPGSNNTGGNGAQLTAGFPRITPVSLRGEFTYLLDSFPLFSGAFPIVPNVEYTKNINPDTPQSVAWNVGVTLGSSKLKGNWQVSYFYRDIGKNAVWAGLNDSDFGVNSSGGTDNRGNVIKASYKPYDSLVMNLSVYLTEKITLNSLSHNGQTRIQADLVWTY